MLVRGPWMFCRASQTCLRWWLFGYTLILSKSEANFDETHTPPLHDVFRQSAITKMTGGSLGSFHCFCGKYVLLLQIQLQSSFSNGDPPFSELLCNFGFFVWTTSLTECSYIFVYLYSKYIWKIYGKAFSSLFKAYSGSIQAYLSSFRCHAGLFRAY